ncbi:60S ribosomal protein L9 [Armadillidium vulgare]|nr:60S ribosomal protein L9 [Armadillidium vulgare]
MRHINTSQTVQIPKGVDVKCYKRFITVKGPRGKLTRSFRGLQIDIQVNKSKKGSEITVEKWFGTKKEVAAVRTVCSHINNMIKGVTKDFNIK